MYTPFTIVMSLLDVVVGGKRANVGLLYGVRCHSLSA